MTSQGKTKHVLHACLGLCIAFGAVHAARAESVSVWPGIGIMKGTHRGYVDTPMGQVHYQERGEGASVLLLHQTPWFSVEYSTVLPHIAAKGFRAIAPDRPGYGLSDVPDKPPTIEDYADNLIHVLDALGLTKVVVVGHNTGSSVAAAFAHRHPDRVSKVVLHSTPLYTADERQQRLARPHWDRWIEADGAHLADRFAGRVRLMPEGNDLQGVQWSTLSFFLAGETEWYGHQAAFSYDMETAIKEISVPTFVMSYEGDALFSQTARVQTLRPDFTYREYPDGYAHLMFDNPQSWVEKFTDWLLED
ncbi:MAG: alpha/beta hydrolase [Rhodospirillaceae bacterium]|nr:alpha/beta hydrolase [Rhodospirillaceae bacterium]MBT5566373.1 alpha/beta hydrolase [Rhodospirillaceae bacterium]MBT6088466.1 alpha/beta hydrolase [Rhodospirillaceae bacterium]MBT6962117.1 alpha/beta hydrolase [Rhodospirillaceae bacterium]MBT7450197.1 alpha/beta hydrolase [Rhodospirillaceae bacterium]